MCEGQAARESRPGLIRDECGLSRNVYPYYTESLSFRIHTIISSCGTCCPEMRDGVFFCKDRQNIFLSANNF
ncbi:MAG: hypothetical protein DRI57_15675 [Deltaproteobacteria bacterium]|nr:MAG: hypothetical protein DRI57_15675 [Deltaproteobacteria bacterium]